MDQLPAGLVIGVGAVLWLVAAVGGTYIRQRDRRSGRERTPSWIGLIAIAAVAVAVALLL